MTESQSDEIWPHRRKARTTHCYLGGRPLPGPPITHLDGGPIHRGQFKGPSEAGQFADDKAVARFERAHELVETPALDVGACRRGGLDELVDSEALAPGVLEDGGAPGAGILLAGGHVQVGDGFRRAVGATMVPVLNLTRRDTGNASRSVWHLW